MDLQKQMLIALIWMIWSDLVKKKIWQVRENLDAEYADLDGWIWFDLGLKNGPSKTDADYADLGDLIWSGQKKNLIGA